MEFVVQTHTVFVVGLTLQKRHAYFPKVKGQFCNMFPHNISPFSHCLCSASPPSIYMVRWFVLFLEDTDCDVLSFEHLQLRPSLSLSCNYIP
jgi:hypothetical protein